MKLSVAICTWNRCRLLQQTLEHFLRLKELKPGSSWELIVVDNGSTDGTRAVVESFSDQLPVKYVFEKRQGHSHARNTAIENVSGDLIVWTDNDVIVAQNWLAAYEESFERNPQAAFFGGKIEPEFESTKPIWLAATWKKCFPVYAARDLGDDEFALPRHQFPFGANFAVRTEIQKQFLFDTSLGRKADGMLGDDETNCLRRINDAEHVGVWVPAAKVKHVIPDDRATPEYVSKYFVGQGILNVWRGEPTMKSVFHALRVAAFNRACYRVKKKNSLPDVWVSHMIRSSIAWGEFSGRMNRTVSQP